MSEIVLEGTSSSPIVCNRQRCLFLKVMIVRLMCKKGSIFYAENGRFAPKSVQSITNYNYTKCSRNGFCHKYLSCMEGVLAG